tara:strand:- start:55 stop:378 length:324 start_codon:yes stop_codon:yes gene_type:complete
MSKILVKNDTKLVVYALDDDQTVDIQSGKTIIGNFDSGAAGFTASDLNSSNCTLVTGVTVPSGTDVEGDGSTAKWEGGKYTYDSETWTKVSGWKDDANLNNRFWLGK